MRTVTVLVLALSMIAVSGGNRTAMAGQKVPSLTDIAYVLADNLAVGGGEIVAFDMRSMQVVGRFPEAGLSQSSEILVSPGGDRLFVSLDRAVKGGKGIEHDIALLEPRGGKLLSVFPMPERVLYIGPGPGTMSLSPDGSRLFVYSYRSTGGGAARYWLSVVNLVSLAVMSRSVNLPGCGPAYFATVKRWVVALCNGSNDVAFVDPHRLKVVARVRLPAQVRHGAAAFLVPRGRDRLYIVTVDLRIVVLGVSKPRVLKTVNTYRQASRSIPQIYAAAISSDDRQVYIGSLDRPGDTDSGFALRSFYLPSLKSGVPDRLPHFAHFVSAPAGGLFTFPMGDSSDRDWRIGYVSPGSPPTKSAVELHGPIIQLAIPGDASPGGLLGGL